MAFSNFKQKEVNCKVLYYGASASGKTENFKTLYKLLANQVQIGEPLSALDQASTPYFDFLPLSMGEISGYKLKLNLYGISPQFDRHMSLPVLLNKVDGIVFVVNSETDGFVETQLAYNKLQKLLEEYHINPLETPTIVQYNKRDSQASLPLHILKYAFNPHAFEDQEASSIQGNGVLETLTKMSRLLLDKMSSESL